MPTGDRAAADALRAHLHTHRQFVEREQARVRRVSLDTWADWADAAGPVRGLDLARFEAALRPGAVTLPDALSELEKVPHMLPAGGR